MAVPTDVVFLLGIGTGILAAQQAPAPPRWSEFEGLRVDAAVDEVLSLNADCRSIDTGENSAMAPVMAAELFGNRLPHDHPPRDTAAVRRALETGVLCRLTLLDGHARALILAIDRQIVAAKILFFTDDSTGMAMDSARAILRARWPRPSSSFPTLDSWEGRRVSAYLIRRAQYGPHYPAVQLAIIDIAACTAFERRIHRAPGTGPAVPC